MAQSIKLGNDTYLHSSGVAVDVQGTTLQQWINTMQVKEIKLVHTATTAGAYSDSIPAHNGVAKTISVPAQTGYTLVGHLCTWATGMGSIFANFDSYVNTLSVPVYITNTSNNTATLNIGFQVHVISLFVKS